MTIETVQPIRKEIVVQAPTDTCFEVFTSGMGTWWNPAYSIGGEPIASVIVEPRHDGRWFERGDQGSECDWGRVLVWDPPHRIVLTWQITPSWTYDADLLTELDITFEDAGQAATHVTLEHRGLDAFGDQADMVRGIFDSPQGWPGLLDRFAAATHDQGGTSEGA